MDDKQVEIVFRPDPADVPEIMRRTRLVLGQPFLEIPAPNRPDEHKVLAVIGGHKVRREDVEMVFNDTILMDFVYRAAGRRSEDNDPPGSPMAEIRDLARQLYGLFGEWAAISYGVLCLECKQELPAHTETCAASKKNKSAAAQSF